MSSARRLERQWSIDLDDGPMDRKLLLRMRDRILGTGNSAAADGEQLINMISCDLLLALIGRHGAHAIRAAAVQFLDAEQLPTITLETASTASAPTSRSRLVTPDNIARLAYELRAEFLERQPRSADAGAAKPVATDVKERGASTRNRDAHPHPPIASQHPEVAGSGGAPASPRSMTGGGAPAAAAPPSRSRHSGTGRPGGVAVSERSQSFRKGRAQQHKKAGARNTMAQHPARKTGGRRPAGVAASAGASGGRTPSGSRAIRSIFRAGRGTSTGVWTKQEK